MRLCSVRPSVRLPHRAGVQHVHCADSPSSTARFPAVSQIADTSTSVVPDSSVPLPSGKVPPQPAAPSVIALSGSYWYMTVGGRMSGAMARRNYQRCHQRRPRILNQWKERRGRHGSRRRIRFTGLRGNRLNVRPIGRSVGKLLARQSPIRVGE